MLQQRAAARGATGDAAGLPVAVLLSVGERVKRGGGASKSAVVSMVCGGQQQR